MRWQVILALIGMLLLPINIFGIMFDIPPFRVHPDYTKDPCCGSESTTNYCATPDKGHVYCLRANPEITIFPAMLGLVLMLPLIQEGDIRVKKLKVV